MGEERRVAGLLSVLSQACKYQSLSRIPQEQRDHHKLEAA